MPTRHERQLSGDVLADRRADYARGLARDGDHAAAADLMRQALERAPRWTAGWVALGDDLAAAGSPALAGEAYRQALALDAEDGHGAGLKLAALGFAPTPVTSPPAFVRGLFDQYAERFEAQLLGGLDYRAPDLLQHVLVETAGEGSNFRSALDLGCGTGLMGERLRPIVDRLVGVDLSPGMLALARRKNIYDVLIEGDILADQELEEPFDLVTAGDVLNYIGDLAPVFAWVSALLAPGGLFAFTVEAHDGDEPYVLGTALRFAHSQHALLLLADDAGLTRRRDARHVLRRDRGQPVEGLFLILEKPGDATG